MSRADARTPEIKTVLLTGATGYLGERVSLALKSAGLTVLCTSRRSSGDHLLDLRKPGLSSFQREIDMLIHLAFDFASLTNQTLAMKQVEATQLLLQHVMEAGCRRLLHVSSIAALEPNRSLYGHVKRCVEQEFRAMEGVSIRPGLLWDEENAGGLLSAITSASRFGRIFLPCAHSTTGLTNVDDLACIIRNAAIFDEGMAFFDVTHPMPIVNKDYMQLRDAVKRASNKSENVIPLPCRPTGWALRCIESLGLPSPARSDSVLSLRTGALPIDPPQEITSIVLRPLV